MVMANAERALQEGGRVRTEEGERERKRRREEVGGRSVARAVGPPIFLRK